MSFAPRALPAGAVSTGPPAAARSIGRASRGCAGDLNIVLDQTKALNMSKIDDGWHEILMTWGAYRSGYTRLGLGYGQSLLGKLMEGKR